MYTLPPVCTVEKAAKIKDELMASVYPNVCVAVDASGVERADLTVLQTLYSLDKELAAVNSRLIVNGHEGVLGEEARSCGMDTWFKQLSADEEK